MIDLKSERLKKGLTLKELGDIIGIDKSYVSLLERGKRDIKNISLLKAKKLCDTFDIKSVKDLYEGWKTVRMRTKRMRCCKQTKSL